MLNLVIPALKRLSQEDGLKLKVSSSYRVKPYLKKKKEKKETKKKGKKEKKRKEKGKGQVVMALSFNLSTWEVGDLCPLEASLVYIVRPLSQQTKQKTELFCLFQMMRSLMKKL